MSRQGIRNLGGSSWLPLRTPAAPRAAVRLVLNPGTEAQDAQHHPAGGPNLGGELVRTPAPVLGCRVCGGEPRGSCETDSNIGLLSQKMVGWRQSAGGLSRPKAVLQLTAGGDRWDRTRSLGVPLSHACTRASRGAASATARSVSSSPWHRPDPQNTVLSSKAARVYRRAPPGFVSTHGSPARRAVPCSDPTNHPAAVHSGKLVKGLLQPAGRVEAQGGAECQRHRDTGHPHVACHST